MKERDCQIILRRVLPAEFWSLLLLLVLLPSVESSGGSGAKMSAILSWLLHDSPSSCSQFYFLIASGDPSFFKERNVWEGRYMGARVSWEVEQVGLGTKFLHPNGPPLDGSFCLVIPASLTLVLCAENFEEVPQRIPALTTPFVVKWYGGPADNRVCQRIRSTTRVR